MKIYLHAGCHKTGTSSIQAFARENPAFLLEHGICWPVTSRLASHNQHSWFALEVKFGKIEETKAILEDAVREAESKGAEALFLSGEGFYNLGFKHVAVCRDLLKNHEVEVFLFLRNIYDYVRSDLGQRLKKTPGLKSLRTIETGVTYNLNYSQRLEVWEQIIDPGKLHVLSYDQHKSDLLPFFFSQIGIDAGATSRILRRRHKDANVSIDLTTQMVLAGAGHNFSIRQYRKIALPTYSRYFRKPPHEAYGVSLLCNFIVEKCGGDYSHPKLDGFRDILLEPRPVTPPSEDSFGASLEYLENAGRFLTSLARRHRRRIFLGKWLHRLGLMPAFKALKQRLKG